MVYQFHTSLSETHFFLSSSLLRTCTHCFVQNGLPNGIGCFSVQPYGNVCLEWRILCWHIWYQVYACVCFPPVPKRAVTKIGSVSIQPCYITNAWIAAPNRLIPFLLMPILWNFLLALILPKDVERGLVHMNFTSFKMSAKVISTAPLPYSYLHPLLHPFPILSPLLLLSSLISSLRLKMGSKHGENLKTKKVI